MKPPPDSASTWLGTACLGLLLGACGVGDSSSPGQAPGPGTVTITDSSGAATTRTTTAQADGTFTLDVAGLQTPYLLRLEWAEGRLYAVAERRENLDVNALTDAAFRSWHDDATDPDGRGDDAEDDLVFEGGDPDQARGLPLQARAFHAELAVALAPLLGRYGVADTRTDRDAVRLLLEDVQATRSGRVLTVTNRAAGGVIYTGRLSAPAVGTFTAANMPGGPGVPAQLTCTAFTYSAYGACQPGGTQARAVASASPSGCSGGAPVTSQACTYLPPVATCTAFTYSAYGACQPGGTQARAVASASPSGCSGGAPVTSQACTYLPPVATCTAFTYSAYGACQPDGSQVRAVASATPAGCAGGAPVTVRACLYVAPLDGAALYAQYCAGCHGDRKKGSSARSISRAIDKKTGGMGTAALRALTRAQIDAIAAAP
ncbi:MAG: cytochrome c [Anaeromyxobacter sp.]|nr:cytochrome c [Anaeromyxobacter sp.]MBL0276879.1 cytochrome c [Anaeromyxobacter sp.]